MTERAKVIVEILEREIRLKASESEFSRGETVIDRSSIWRAAEQIDTALRLAEVR